MTAILSTYRIQLRPDFGLNAVGALVPYLARLGVSHVYLSPLLRARSGSDHGYDVVDPTMLNPALGSEADLEALVDTLRRHDMGLILDVVPNHMATGSENRFWEDVLMHGPASAFSHWFDIDWGAPEARRPRRILQPVLGERLGRVIARGELKIVLRDRQFRIEYFDQCFPLDPATIPFIVEAGSAAASSAVGDDPTMSELESILARLRSLPPRDASARAERGPEAEAALRQLWMLFESAPHVHDRITSAVAAFGSNREGQRRLRRLVAAQAYRLAYWRRAAREINYRRFFTISHLVALRMEDARVFATTHEKVLRWIDEGKVDGLRIDHIDGLLDPAGYLRRLRDTVASSANRSPTPFPLYVEKILGREERLPESWPVAGTTGYDFLAELEDAFLDADGFRAVGQTYRRFTRRHTDFAQVARTAGRKVLAGPLAAEVRRLSRLAERFARCSAQTSPDTDALTQAIVEVLVALPVYRTYLDPERLVYRAEDRAILTQALSEARRAGRAEHAALELLSSALLLSGRDALPAGATERAAEFAQRFQQTSVSVAAKSIEDTAFYIFVPLASRNEVGNEPDATLADNALHAANQRRANRWPDAMLCTSTHDTKRSADVRARLSVLSEIPEAWKRHLRRWHRWNRHHRRLVRGSYAPDRNTEYLLYQTLVGVWPLGQPASAEQQVPAAFKQRIQEYMLKAAREAKLQTSWVEPNARFEAALSSFVDAVLTPPACQRFLADLASFAGVVGRSAVWAGLSRTLIHLTSPGVPDIYQGDELWNLNLVDPDNRRPVDFEQRRALLSTIVKRHDPLTDGLDFIEEMLASPEDGRVKLHVIHRTLRSRREFPELFSRGDYIALTVSGPRAGHVFAFARRKGDRAAIIVAPSRVMQLSGASGRPPVGTDLWGDTRISLPEGLSRGPWHSRLTDESRPAAPSHASLPVAEALRSFPVALLLST